MSTYDMSVGKPRACTGDIRSVIPDAYGIFYCEIESPENLQHPLLQRRIETTHVTRTVAGLGKWTGWITSIEMDRAIELGYKCKILLGYRFDKANVFGPLITKLYNLRTSYLKSYPMNLIAKLLMNSVYGKLGKPSNQPIVRIFNVQNVNDKKKSC